MKQVFTRVAVKVGSNVLTRRDGTLDVTRMSALVDQIAELHKSGVEIILISSERFLRLIRVQFQPSTFHLSTLQISNERPRLPVHR